MDSDGGFGSMHAEQVSPAANRLPDGCDQFGSQRNRAEHRLKKRLENVQTNRATLKHILRLIGPNGDNLRGDRPFLWLNAAPPWPVDNVRGRSHHQSHLKKIMDSFHHWE